MSEFEKLEALTMNSTAFCSVNAVNDLRGKTLVVGIYPDVSVDSFRAIQIIKLHDNVVARSVVIRNILSEKSVHHAKHG